jgi:hypothetical protein
MTMPTPNGIHSVLGDIMVSYNCELTKDSAYKAAAALRSWSLRPPRSTKLLLKFQSRSAQPQPWIHVLLLRKFASACPTHPRKSSLRLTSTPNRNSRSPVSSGTTPTSSHGAHPTCPTSPGNWLSTPPLK